ARFAAFPRCGPLPRIGVMLSVQDLSCRRGGRALFAGVRLALSAGQWAHVRGANGAGKTSLLRIVAGLSPPDSGEVCWNGVPVARTITRPAKLWILDEPLTALDVTAIDNFTSLIGDHLARGGVALVTSHQPLPLAGGEEVLL